METLKEMLLKEQERLEQIMEKTRNRMQNAPEGTLRLSNCRNSIQYYHRTIQGKENGTYIPKEQIGFIRSLAQKSYDEKIMRLASKRLSQIKKLVKYYGKDEILLGNTFDLLVYCLFR